MWIWGYGVGMSDDVEDPFAEARKGRGVLAGEFQGKGIPMILRHADVLAAAKDVGTFSNDAPFRVPIPSEEDVRSVRQLPIETDPPEHTGYRAIVNPFFKRPNGVEMGEKVGVLVERLLGEAMERDSVEVVRGFALPLQSHALTYLLDVAEAEAEEWIGWGIHVFRDGGDGEKKGAALENYINAKLDASEEVGGFFKALTEAEYEGRKLTREEMAGFANLAFAGGRDTVIHMISSMIGYFGKHPERLEELRSKPKIWRTATEEFMRVISPITHIGRVCPMGADVHGEKVEPGERASMCWASANMDETVFDAPDEVRFDRRPNPHLAFGNGTHFCLGAAHARLIARTLIERLCGMVGSIEVVEAVANVEDEVGYRRENGYEKLVVRVLGR